MIPLAWPGLATVAIHSAYTTWNDYIVALVFTTTDDMRTLNIGLTNMAIGQYGNDWGLLTSGSIINFFANDHFVCVSPAVFHQRPNERCCQVKSCHLILRG